MPTWIWWVVLAVNVLTFLVFGVDKLLARLGRRRVRERTLLWWTFAGGCIGAWCAMQLFRHKTQKGSFRWRAVLLTVVNPLWACVWWQWHGWG